MRTILFSGTAINIMCTLLIVALWRQNRKRFEGMELWALFFALQTLGVLLIMLRGAIPGWISIILANALLVAGIFMGFIGLERFVGKKGSQVHNVLLLILYFFSQAYLTFVRPSVNLRSIIYSVFAFIICFQCMWLMLRRIEAAMRPLTRPVGMVFGAFCIVFGFRAFFFSLGPRIKDFFLLSEGPDAIVQIIVQMLLILLTYGLTVMVNRRLLLGIQAQEEKFSKAFHSSPYAVILTRLSDGRVFEVNEFFLKITGYPLEDVLGKTIFDLHFWGHPEDRAAVLDELTRGGSIRGCELQFRKKSGEPIVCLFSAEVLTIDGVKHLLSSIVDISDRKRAEAEREQALSEVKVLGGLLPICMHCKKIRDDKGYWNKLEFYIEAHSAAEFSHGICPECAKKLYPDFEPDSGP